MKILVCGGAGYIGSHLVRELRQSHNVIIFDNLSTGHKSTIPANDKMVTFVQGDIRDSAALDKVFATHKPDAVMHFCASIVVSESCVDPLKYYENNVSGTISLLQCMQRHGTKYFIFSSTAALFGNPTRIPIESEDPTAPLNPYGESKLMVEQILHWCDSAYGIKFACLRYFNACGAHADGDIGEDHEPETHLIPLVLEVPLGKREKVMIYGDDYDTKDGTCVRDYIHVTDLATAHIKVGSDTLLTEFNFKALEYLVRENTSNHFNLGSGLGYTVKEVIDAARRVTGHSIPTAVQPRRPGDAAVLIADSKKAEEVLNWKRIYTSIDDIVASAWKFHQKHSTGLN